MVSAISFLCSLLSFINQVIIAKVYGASIELDAYLIAVSVPLLIIGLTNGVFSFLIVPELVKYKTCNAPFYKDYTGALLTTLMCVSIIISIAAYYIIPILVKIIAPFLPSEVADETVTMARIAGTMCGAVLLFNYYIALYNSANKFILPAIINSMPYIGMIAFALLMTPLLGIQALVYGMFIGYLLAILTLYVGLRNEVKLNFKIPFFYQNFKYIFISTPIVLISALCFTIYGTIDAFWASRIGPQNLSYLSYNQRLIIAIGNIIILGPFTVLSPYFTEKVVLGQMDVFKNKIEITVRLIVFCAVPLCLILSLMRVEFIELLFQRGAFGINETKGVSSILPGMLCGMIPMIIVAVLFKALYAKSDIRGVASISILGSILYFSISGILSKIFGLKGIVIGYVITWWVLLIFAIKRIWINDIVKILSLENIKFLLNILLLIILVGLIIMIGQSLFIQPLIEIGIFNLLLRVAIIAMIACALFVFVSVFVLKMPEALYLLKIFPFKISKRLNYE